MPKKAVVFVTRKLPEIVEQRLKHDYDAKLNPEDRVYTGDELVELSKGADAIIPCHTEKLTAEIIGRLPDSVRAICCFSVGYDHIDTVAAAARGIVVTNTPDVLNAATAEIAMLLILGAARRSYEGERQIRTDTWADWSAVGQLGLQVTGKKLGILGMGRVGQILARRARGFDMEIHYFNRSRLPEDLELGAVYHDSVEALLPHCQFLSIHCPSTPETRHIINAERLSLLPDEAVLVNTARGAVVDDNALIDALQARKLFAAGLDVFNNEPSIDPRYKNLSNTFLLPHIGSATRETREAMGMCALDNLDAINSGIEPPNRVT